MPNLGKHSALWMFVAAMSPAFAGDTPDKPKDTDDPKHVICKSELETGSLLPGPRICHTKAQWDEIARQAQQDLRNAQGNEPASMSSRPNRRNSC